MGSQTYFNLINHLSDDYSLGIAGSVIAGTLLLKIVLSPIDMFAKFHSKKVQLFQIENLKY